MTTYIVIEGFNNLTEAQFLELKELGVEQTSILTIRESLDGDKAILKWAGDKPDGIDEDLSIIFEGTCDEIRQYIEDNQAAWESPAE